MIRASSIPRAARHWRRPSKSMPPARALPWWSITSNPKVLPVTMSVTRILVMVRATVARPAEPAAEALVDWLATDPTGSGDPDFLIMGDLNSYAQEDTIDEIKAGSDDTGWHKRRFHQPDRSLPGRLCLLLHLRWTGWLSRPCAGESQACFAQVTGAADWHINSDEPDVSGLRYHLQAPSRSPFKPAIKFCAAIQDIWSREVLLALAMCGTITILSSVSSGTVQGMGSGSVTSSPAPKMRFAFNAS